MKVKRFFGFLLALAMVLGLFPGVSAEQRNAFVLVAESGGRLVIAPEYVPYTEDQTVRQALLETAHDFVGLEDDWIMEIDGVGGNYTRSDQNGGFDLNAPAASVTHFRFSEDTDSRPSQGLMELMSAMAEYALKPEDVRAAAKGEYELAYSQFVGLDSASASVLAGTLLDAVRAYEDAQSGSHYTVSFEDCGVDCAAMDITVTNPYGRVWTARRGRVELPAGTYTFLAVDGDTRAEGSFTVDGARTVSLTMPREDWLETGSFRLSGSYGSADNEENRFTDEEFQLGEWEGRRVTVPVYDSFTGTVYTCAAYSDALTVLPTLSAIYPGAASGGEKTAVIPFGSLTSGAADVLGRGAAGNTVIYRVSAELADRIVYSQDYTVEFVRIPTLTGITVTDQRGVGQAATMPFDGRVTDYTYKVLDTVTAVQIEAVPLEESYEVEVIGGAVDGDTVVEIAVRSEGRENRYQLTILPGAGKALSFVTESSDVTVEVVNRNGQVMPWEKFREGSDRNRYQYTLVPGETYTYIATAGEYYHTADEFTMEEAADSTIQVNVPTDNWLDALALGFGGQASRYQDTLKLEPAFDPAGHHYTATLVDIEHIPYVWVEAENAAITAIYDQIFASSLYHGLEKTVELTAGKTTGEKLSRILMDENPHENTLTIRLSREEDGIRRYQDYIIELRRSLTLEDLSAQCDGLAMTLVQPNGETGFDPSVTEYSVTVSMAARELKLDWAAPNGSRCYGEEQLGYVVEGDTGIKLDGTIETQYAALTVSNPKAPDGTTTYKLSIQKSPPVLVSFETEPAQALLAVYETQSGQRLWPESGTFSLCEGYSYRYVLSCAGYAARTGTLSVARDEADALVVTDGDAVHPVLESGDGGSLTLCWGLERAPVNGNLNRDMTSPWPSFRGNDDNNGVTDAPIPTAAEDGTLYWANQIGSGFDADAVGSPILVDGDIITYAGDTIYRIDTISGEIKRTAKMDHKSSFSITPPAYAEGMVFVALSSGTVQAFNADTLESLWLYQDPLGGQPNCPLTVRDGYLYTGFWNSETGDANFVCLSITDEDPAREKEDKAASWYHTAGGGYYWAGAYVSDSFVLVGTDDGTNFGDSQTSRILMFDRRTGKLLDSLDALNGDIRSTIVYDKESDAYYFTSKGGSFYGVRVKDGKFAQLWSVALVNGSASLAMSTSSPVVYNGRAYIGVSGAGQFSAYSGHSIHVIDLNARAIAYTAETQGYPQTSGLLTTAYEEESGYVYIYFFDNMTPGKLRVLRDKPGQTGLDYVTTEGERDTVYALFTPTGGQSQYAICSPIADEYGTVYFKNDSAHLMAFGPKIVGLEVTGEPYRMVYQEGEAFDPSGMTVTATYANGRQRDVTDYVTITADPITADSRLVTISFDHVMYHNQEDGTEMVSGVASTTPSVTLEVRLAGVEGDVDSDGMMTAADAVLIVKHYNELLELTAEEQQTADVNRDGVVDIRDANILYGWINLGRNEE